MKRSALALGASVLALALTAGPAAADPGTGQVVGDSTAAAQVGAVSVDAPVRVLSDGDSATTGAAAGGSQTTTETTGGAQVTSVNANAPVRVLSDGDDSQRGGSTAGPESTTDSTGSAQVGAAGVDAPVRVASDGDNSSGEAGATSGSGQSVDDSSGSAQVGSPVVHAPVRVLTGGTLEGLVPGDQPDPSDPGDLADTAGDLLDELEGLLLGHPSGGGDVVAAPAGAAPSAGDGSPSPDDLRRLVDGSDPDPAISFVPNGSGGNASGGAGVIDVAANGLPVTGLGLVQAIALGIAMLASGLTFRLVPGGKRR
jgi:hypothetical protein